MDGSSDGDDEVGVEDDASSSGDDVLMGEGDDDDDDSDPDDDEDEEADRDIDDEEAAAFSGLTGALPHHAPPSYDAGSFLGLCWGSAKNAFEQASFYHTGSKL